MPARPADRLHFRHSDGAARVVAGTWRRLGALCAVLVTGVALTLLPLERAARAWDRSDPNAAFSLLLGGDVPVRPWSHRGQEQALLQCHDGMSALVATVYPDTARRAVALRCRALATWIVARAPGFALAHLTQGRAALTLGDTAAAARGLTRSAQLARGEGWLAERRLALAFDPGFGAGDGDTATLIDDDIALLLARPAGIEWLAAAYLAGGAPAERIADRARDAPAPAQAAFLAAIRRRM